METKINLAKTVEGETNKVLKDHAYMVDFSKLTSVNDLILILSAVGFSFPGDHPFIEMIKPFLALENPIPLPKRPMPEMKEVTLPKLKTIKPNGAE